jgi:hypothetical protein
LQQIVRKELEGTKLEISVAQLWLHLAIWYQAYCNVGVRLLSWSNPANQSLPVSSKPKRKMGAVTNTNNAKQFGFQIELLKDMEVEHWCFGCVLKGKQGRLKAFQSLMYKLLHVTGSWRTCHLSMVNLIYRTCLTSHQLRQKWWTMNRRILTTTGKNQQKQTTIQYFNNHATTTKQLEVADNHQ